MNELTCRELAFSAVSLALVMVSGCAGTAPKPVYSHEIVSEARITSPDTAQVSVDAPETVKLLPVERDRLAQKIQLQINTRKQSNTRGGDFRTYAVDLHLSRYEKGNAFARAMLVGLGQIHIDGQVAVYPMPQHTLVGEFQRQKTFAWAGIYGAATSMDTIEDTFADAVAAVVTGQQETKAKN